MTSEDSFFITGRRAKQTLRKDMAIYIEYNTIELDGVILKRVNTAMIDGRKTTYFKCKNMKTPYRVSGICHFSGRIADFPDNLEIEIINDHNPTCSCLKKNASIVSSFYQVKKEKHEKRSVSSVKRAKRKKRRSKKKEHSDTSEFYELTSNKEQAKSKINPVNNRDKNIFIGATLKIPYEIECKLNLDDVDIYVQLKTQADLEKEKVIILKYPHLFA